MTRMRTEWGVAPSERGEGTITKGIEQVTSQVPSGGYLAAAVACMAASALLQVSGRKHESLFVGQWAPAILIMGLYNKMVRLHGSE